ncbi:MAG: flagellar hook-associated protein FlgK [Paracoccus sp. (in: a-proteobacteria)]|nr:flagellar hook-associated protein FlgK [Paracoccus sp. (in: a-proteobacteria)]
MSIANALNNAISGLTAVSRGTEVVSSNLANALTPGYSRRELELSPRMLAGNGGGVQVSAVNRIVSNTLLADLRLANADMGRSSVAHGFHLMLEKAIGLPQDAGSLPALVSGLETALVSSAVRPDSDNRLRAVADAANQLAGRITSISEAIQDSRTNADREIGLRVAALNDDLHEVARLNRQIIIEQANGREAASMLDARQAVIERISVIVPLREMPRDNGWIALFTVSGATLLDGKAPLDIGFSPAGRLTAEMDPDSGPPGRLFIDGEAANDHQMAMFAGGSLSELFRLRDDYAVAAQAGLDAFARELYDRFSAADPTVDPGRPGLFTDGGGDFDPANERGLAARLRLNANIDPDQGGAVWRIRDGLNAALPGDVGDSHILNALAATMNAIHGFSSPAAPGSSGTPATFAAGLLSDAASARLTAELRMTHDTARHDSLRGALLAQGVDSDREMEMLLQLEKAYAANARVIQAVNEMLDSILRI